MYEICLARACPHLQNAYQCKTQSKIETRLLFTNKKTVGGMSPAVIFPLIVVGILVFVFSERCIYTRYLNPRQGG
jgi:hypothetical protein